MTGEVFTRIQLLSLFVIPELIALTGALAGALLAGQFRLIGFADSGDTLRNLVGGALMGVGGITALGCTIGQGVTGVSTLALGSVLALVAIIPTVVATSMGIPFTIASFYGGTGLLIVVSVVLDLVQKIDSHLTMRNYPGLLEGDK